MNLLLDTTIQIDRITGSKERKRAVEEILKDNRLFCSTYVLGEYYANLVNDFVTLYGLFMIDKNIAETGKRINERIFGRSQARVAKVFFNILELCDGNIEEIEDEFSLYLDVLQDEFYLNIEEIIDTTKCARADRKVFYEEGVPVLQAVKCTKEKEVCGICPFWRSSQKEIDKIIEKGEIDKKIQNILNSARENEREYLGRNCLTLGDTIISLEALKDGRELGVCSSNKKDFQPICSALGVELVVPDYSWKGHT